MADDEHTREQRYRQRARELRAIASDLMDENARRILLQAADEYELLADGARQLQQSNHLTAGL